MNILALQGLTIAKNLIFKRFLKKGSFLLRTPMQLAVLLTTAWSQLSKESAGQNPFQHVKALMHTTIRMIKAYASGQYRHIHYKTILLGVGVLIYLVTPIDLVPDFLPGLGLLDDVSLMTWFVSSVTDDLKQFEEWELNQHFS